MSNISNVPETPTINGYYVRNARTMEGLDGLIIKCELYRNRKKLGAYFDAGDGGEYRYSPENGSQAEVEAELRRWRKKDTGDGSGFRVYWNIGILVEELLFLEDKLKNFKSFRKKGMDCVSVTDNATKRVFYAGVPSGLDDARLDSLLKENLKFTDFSWERITPSDFHQTIKTVDE